MNEVLALDTVSANIVNRVAAGSVLRGEMSWNGGVLLQGHLEGAPIVIHGGLVLMEDATIRGSIEVHGDAFLFGQAGAAGEHDGALQLKVHGVLHIGATAKTYGAIHCQSFEAYVGSEVNSVITSGDALR
jgi:cytoskeletal protein CcmA (bactofilin family)